MNTEKEKRDQYWVMSRRNRSHGLDPIREACRAAGNPQDELKIIHVAGTNGKGSTVSYLRAILNAAGFRVGTFTSPHLSSHFDRIRIDDVWIEEDVFNAYLDQYMELIERLDLGMFEIDTLISFAWFRDQKVDYAIIETGLGGRLDNTNIIRDPLLSVITTIGHDHTQILGSRTEQIAFEKAGIIKPYGRCLYGNVPHAAQQVITARSQRIHACASKVPQYRSIAMKKMIFMGTEYTVNGAEYQKENAALALRAAWFLGISVNDEKTIRAVRECQWKGRFETVSLSPCVILDGAHNEEGMKALCGSLAGLKRPLVAVFSALRDKPGRKMAAMLKEHCDELIITQFENARADTADDLLVADAVMEKDWRKALAMAMQKGESGTVLITGSLYFISVVRQQFIQ